ncbi:MAG TPA: hypothetical protein VGO23_19085 [Pseudonocardia sp.]|nr:hypothetical protein [Pseudonocardia sp.]
MRDRALWRQTLTQALSLGAQSLRRDVLLRDARPARAVPRPLIRRAPVRCASLRGDRTLPALPPGPLRVHPFPPLCGRLTGDIAHRR